ncbi:PEP-CTERM sorting domain-containing protein [Massilia genomosp. 1]|uniref:PEP-CTERM sorting domain-containing protein n=1 Tax=Massilia genomosp. 1 TaxID=2609280 RepID=A0ABX0MU86_9BURK|nr:PEP-CTERM sorting domain-containing protein [Massilia genomosp. 1]NHZ61419.1 PEP-CTERM sorting domain-containing protein [Massilia genomosp. 1]
MKSYIAAFTLGLLAASNASAEMVTFDYTAKIDEALHFTNHGAHVDSLQSISFNNTTIEVGYTMRGSFTIDLDTPASLHLPYQSPNSVYTEYGNPTNGATRNLATIKVDQSGYGFTPKPQAGGMRIEITDGAVGRADSFVFNNYNLDPNTGRSESLTFALWQANGSLLTSTRLPSSLDLSRADMATLVYSYRGPNSTDVFRTNAVLTSLSVRTASPVPEPSSYAMLLLGVFMICAVNLHKTKSNSCVQATAG